MEPQLEKSTISPREDSGVVAAGGTGAAEPEVQAEVGTLPPQDTAKTPDEGIVRKVEEDTAQHAAEVRGAVEADPIMGEADSSTPEPPAAAVAPGAATGAATTLAPPHREEG